MEETRELVADSAESGSNEPAVAQQPEQPERVEPEERAEGSRKRSESIIEEPQDVKPKRGRPSGSKDKQPRVKREKVEEAQSSQPVVDTSRLRPRVVEHVPSARHEDFDEALLEHVRRIQEEKRKNSWGDILARREFYRGSRRV